MMAKRHCNEFIHTTFTNRGRVAGTGIVEDNYSEESFPGGRFGGRSQKVDFPERTEEEKASLNGPVIVKKLKEVEE